MAFYQTPPPSAEESTTHSMVPSFTVTPHGIRTCIPIRPLHNMEGYVLAILSGITHAGYGKSYYTCLLLYKDKSAPKKDLPSYTCFFTDEFRLLITHSSLWNKTEQQWCNMYISGRPEYRASDPMDPHELVVSYLQRVLDIVLEASRVNYLALLEPY